MLKILSAAAVLLVTTATTSQDYRTSNSDAIVSGVNQDTTVDCNRAAAIVDGSNNNVVFNGVCSSLIVKGENNDVSITLAPDAFIRIEGTNNTIKSVTAVPSTGARDVSVDGTNNTVTVSLAGAASVAVAGTNNDVIWRSNVRKLPRVRISGVNNDVKRVR
jgi:hypothetical protein